MKRRKCNRVFGLATPQARASLVPNGEPDGRFGPMGEDESMRLPSSLGCQSSAQSRCVAHATGIQTLASDFQIVQSTEAVLGSEDDALCHGRAHNAVAPRVASFRENHKRHEAY